jgi:hypothetical protein
MISSGDGHSSLLAWKIKGTSLAVLRQGSLGPIGKLDKGRIIFLGDGVVTLQFADFAKSFTFAQVDLMEKVPHLERKSFTKAVMLSGGDERVILLELAVKSESE